MINDELDDIIPYKNSGLEKRFKTFISQLKRKKIAGSFVVSQETANILKIAISISDGTAKQMMQLLKVIGKKLIKIAPIELAIGNIVRRFLFIVREEYIEYEKKINSNVPVGEIDFERDHPIKNTVITQIDHFMEELNGLYEVISEKASEHIHNNEVIMTFGRSKTVSEFLKTAAKKRQFEVIVPESAPKGVGKHMASELANSKIKTTLISDSAIFAMMARVNKVIIGVHAVLANGGLLSWTGTHMLVSAAKYHNVPVVVLVPLYKLTPIFPNENQNLLNDLNSPSEVLQFENVEDQDVEVVVQNPGFDYVPPEYVNLFLTNSPAGGHNPSYIYRLLVEYYHPDDSDIY